jgi:hypothetical protein
MSAHEPRPAPRGRKLVLRKIADGAPRAPVAPPSSSYTGPRPTMRPPAQLTAPSKPRPALVLPFEPELSAMEEEPEEVEPEEEEAAALEESRWREAASPGAPREVAFEGGASDLSSSEAGAAAAMTPAAPRPVAIPGPAGIPQPSEISRWSAMRAQSSQASQPFAPARATTPGPSRDSSRRTSVAPVVATLPPIDAIPRLPPMRGRLSVDSKVLVAGGALAAAMLLVALGVLLGQHTAATNAPPAAAAGQYPVVVEAKAPAAVALPPAAVPVEERPAGAGAVVAKAEQPATVDVQQLPSAARPRPQGWSVVAPAPKGAGGAGWTVAGPAPARPAIPAAINAAPAARPTPAVDAPESVASASAVGPDSPAPSAATPPAAVDPLVQAVREDIREDEARTK